MDGRAREKAGSPGGDPCREGHVGVGGGVAVQALRSEEMPVRHLAAGHPNLDFRGLVWRYNCGGFGLAPPMTTQGCWLSSAQDWGLGSPLSTSSVGCVLGSLLQPPHLHQAGLPTEARASVPRPRTHCSLHGVVPLKATVIHRKQEQARKTPNPVVY